MFNNLKNRFNRVTLNGIKKTEIGLIGVLQGDPRVNFMVYLYYDFNMKGNGTNDDYTRYIAENICDLSNIDFNMKNIDINEKLNILNKKKVI